MNSYNKAIVEVLEIIKYLDEDLKSKINYQLLEELKKDMDKNYHFEINKEIPFYDNEFLEETYDILAELIDVNL